jgi:hypothetical protein
MNSNKKYNIPKKTFRPREGARAMVLVSLHFMSTFTEEMVLVSSITNFEYFELRVLQQNVRSKAPLPSLHRSSPPFPCQKRKNTGKS